MSVLASTFRKERGLQKRKSKESEKTRKNVFSEKNVQSAQITNMHATPNNRTRESDSSWSIRCFSCESKKIVLGRHYPDIEGRLHLRFATGWRVVNVRKKGRCSKSKLSAFLILSAISNFRMAYLLLKFASCLVPFLQNLCEELMWVYSLYIAKKFVVLLYTSFYSKQICNYTLNWVAKSIKHSSGGGKNGEKNKLISGL